MAVNNPLFYYIITDNGDGSASMRAFKTSEDAEKAKEHELKEYGMGTLSEGVQSFFASDIQETFDAED